MTTAKELANVSTAEADRLINAALEAALGKQHAPTIAHERRERVFFQDGSFGSFTELESSRISKKMN